MKWKKADLVLAGAALAFVLFTGLRWLYPQWLWVKMGFFIAEAALVGGIADWFAITALFRRPLGFPWHTELIPRNREKTIDAIVKVVEGELLGVAVIKSKLAHVRLIDGIIDWLDRQEGKRYLTDFLGRLSQEALGHLQPKTIARYIERPVKDRLRRIPLPALLTQWGQRALTAGEEERWIALLMEEMHQAAARPETRDRIYRFLRGTEKKQSEGLFSALVLTTALLTNSYNPSEAADSLHRRLLESLAEMKDPQHPLRLRLKEILLEKTAGLTEREELVEAIESWKERIIDELPLEGWLRALWPSGTEGLVGLSALSEAPVPLGGAGSAEIRLPAPLQGTVDSFVQRVVHDAALREQLEERLKEALFRIIEKEHRLIGNIVRNVLNAFTNDDLNRFIEDKAGNDLQWIRINGSLVGGIVGLILFLFLQFLYHPLLVPLLRGQ
ncbi:DUF445 family protein [Heliobacterium gestii]|uniref:DUF445 family protein n=1 Tax=Heliomicrobium gestii TaxID=2699 RepID=A0A845L7M8_HELGE|nr:DUF445 domain-containing protein [Heliomicrobium gestii]MBM7866061.1 uncharacterized membrane-anchored protein YjiN (DUF445 family) [Heliomicrobium gestii]MZP42612.1 DUF445 family protein [Heliomicrobium gestii]